MQKSFLSLPALLKQSVISTLVAAFVTSAHAEDNNPEKSEIKLDAVLVNAKKIESTPKASDINNDYLNARRASTSDTASLLQDVPGVSIYGAGGTSSLPAIHGMADDRVRVKVDGMDLIASCPNHMNSPLSYIDPTNVGSLKVYAGITPVSAGGDSIGGTIIASSKPPEFAAPGEGVLKKGEVGTFYRSNNRAKGVNLSATVASENLSVAYSGSTVEAENYKAGGNFKNFTQTGRSGHTLALDEVGSTAYKNQTHTLGIALKGDGNLIEGSLGYQDTPYQLYPNQRMDMLNNEQKKLNLRYLGEFKWGQFEARAYHERVSHYMDFGGDKQYIYGPNAPSTIIAPGMPMYTNGRTTGFSAKADIQLTEDDLLKIGAEYQRYRLNDWWPPSPADLTGMVSSPGVPATSGGMAPYTFLNINNGKRDRLAAFSEWEAHWNPQWMSLLGVRLEQVKTDAENVHGYNNMMAGYAASATAFNARNHQKTDHNLDFTALGRYTPSVTSTYEFGYAQKTRSPNLYERYSWSQNSMALIMNNFVGDGNGYLGNIDLKPEIAHTFSATVDWHDAAQAWGLKATPYLTYVSDFIDAVRCNGSGLMMNALCGGAANNTATKKFVQMQYANQSARIYGLDLSGHMPLASGSAGNFELRGVVNLTRGENRDTGYGLYNIMPLNAKLVVGQTLGGWKNSVELIGVESKNHLSEPRNEIKTSGYALVNLRGSYAWDKGNVRVDFGVENLFDRLYYLPLGGAYSGQGMTMSTNGIPWGIAVPGMGRSLYAGANIKF
jgi:iron complex outermembrane recepter protein